MAKLTTLSVKNARAGRHADGAGLYLLVKPTGGRSWLLRIQVGRRRRDIGLGSVDLGTRRLGVPDPSDDIPLLERRVLTLSEAREKAATDLAWLAGSCSNDPFTLIAPPRVLN